MRRLHQILWLGIGAAIVLLASPSSAQVVTGTVVDSTEAPVPGVEIRFSTEAARIVGTVLSDEEGRFIGPALRSGRYWLILNRIGYGRLEMGPLAVEEGDTVEVVLQMPLEPVPLAPITVTASPRPWWEHLEPPALWEFREREDYYTRLGAGDFFTYEELKPYGGQQAALTITDLAHHLFPDPHPVRRNSFRIKGFGRECFPAIFLDGHVLHGPGGAQGNEPPIIDDWIHSSQIAGVEVYRGASDVPGEFRIPGANCGAVAIWSVRGPRRGG
ncbi:MAG: carboxypeptidase-like regulatory domain-containing protein [Gemmatimonadetes bacterium]|nr:carboxypeptidase-like regulatory domain-containing protein [Gemmatimonadota bacterium]